MRDRTIVILFFSLLIILALFISGTTFGMLAGIIGLFVLGIVWVMSRSESLKQC